MGVDLVRGHPLGEREWNFWSVIATVMLSASRDVA